MAGMLSVRGILLVASVCSVLSFAAAAPDVLASSGRNGSGLSGSAGPTGPHDPTVGLLPSYNDAYANWKNAGLQSVGGISTVDASRTVCTTVNPSGITAPPATRDDADNINAAIRNCAPNTIIQLAAGTYYIDVNEEILLNKSITLRGYGNCHGRTFHSYCQTVIVKPNGVLAYIDPVACGTSTSSQNSCGSFAYPIIRMSENDAVWGSDWSGCFDSTNGTRGDGNTCAGTVASLTADASPGDTTIHVSATAPFKVGMWVLIDEDPAATWEPDPKDEGTGKGRQIWAAPDAFNSSGGPATGRIVYLYMNPYPGWGATSAGGPGQGPNGAIGESCNYAAMCFRPYGEIHLISSINSAAGTITFDDPIMDSMRRTGGHNARVYYPTPGRGRPNGTYQAFLQYAGVENMSLRRGPYGKIVIDQCAYCWVKNVDSNSWAHGAVEVQESARVEINNVYGYDCWSNSNSGVEYAFDFMEDSTEIYLVNSISRLSGKNMTARAGGAGSVVAYNYMDDVYYQPGSGPQGNWWIDLSANGTHFPGAHHMLFEGNSTVNMDGDNTHGSGSDYMTFFRNNATGYRSPFTDPVTGFSVNDFTGQVQHCPAGTVASCAVYRGGVGGLRGAGPMTYNYWYAFVGNVIGISGETTTGHGWVYNNASRPRINAGYIWNSGWDSYIRSHDPNLSYSNPSAYIFRHGDYDYVNGSIADWTSGYSHTLPNSFYLTSAPAFFRAGASCKYPWPWVTPTGSRQVEANSCGGSGLPAKARYDAGTPFTQP